MVIFWPNPPTSLLTWYLNGPLGNILPHEAREEIRQIFRSFFGQWIFKEKMLLRFTDLSSSIRKNKDDLDAKCFLAKNQPNSGQKKKKKPRLPCFFLALYSKQILTEILISGSAFQLKCKQACWSKLVFKFFKANSGRFSFSSSQFNNSIFDRRSILFLVSIPNLKLKSWTDSNTYLKKG